MDDSSMAACQAAGNAVIADKNAMVQRMWKYVKVQPDPLVQKSSLQGYPEITTSCSPR
jgi:hypothetical protein